MERIKIATHQCLFGQEKWILKNLENCYPFVDKIYLSYSNLPWGYNHSARSTYTNNLDIETIKNSIYADKVEILHGDWLNEQDQRNHCLDKAKSDGMDYLIIQDADEFYLNEDYLKLVNFIKENPNNDVYRCAWISFWKTTDYVVVNENGDDIVGYPQIAININNGVRFKDRRNPNSDSFITIPDIICYHMSFVLTDEECMTKLKTWGHSHEFNTDSWFNNVWLNWTINTRNMHPIDPKAWSGTKKNNRILPIELMNHGL